MDIPGSPKSQSRPRPKQTPSAPGALHLSGLPRYHPAAYSNSSSKTNTPSTGSSVTSPYVTVAYGRPLSPKTASSRFFEPAQRQQLSYYQQHLLQASLGATTPSGSGKKPESPKLQPSAGRPGPVTPLELGDEMEGYFSAGRNSPNVDAIMREEKKRLSDLSLRKPS
jgi:hypothetical protein